MEKLSMQDRKKLRKIAGELEAYLELANEEVGNWDAVKGFLSDPVKIVAIPLTRERLKNTLSVAYIYREAIKDHIEEIEILKIRDKEIIQIKLKY